MHLDEKNEESAYPDYENSPFGIARLGPKYTYLDVFNKFPQVNHDLWTYEKIQNYGLAFFFPACLSAYINKLKNIPILHKGYRHIGLGLFISTCMVIYTNVKIKKDTREQAILRHYLELHPERFPTIERKKYKDLVLDWYPIRTF